MTNALYDVQLAKGQGMVPETVVLLNEWEEGQTPVELRNRVLSAGILPKATAYRISDGFGK